MLADQGQKLLGIKLAGQWPQARSGAAGKNDWYDHGNLLLRVIGAGVERDASADTVILEALFAH
ncbi:MAG: hypothetical protein AAFU65_14825, partial [Pseudomonadota bacterium]